MIGVLTQEEMIECKNLALTDFERFCHIAKVDVIQLKACILRAKGKSLQQISIRLNTPKSTIKDKVRKCAE